MNPDFSNSMFAFLIASSFGYLILFRFSEHIAPEWLSWKYPFGYVPHAFAIHLIASISFSYWVVSTFPEKASFFSDEVIAHENFTMGLLGISFALGIFSAIYACIRTARYHELKHFESWRMKNRTLGRKGAEKIAKELK